MKFFVMTMIIVTTVAAHSESFKQVTPSLEAQRLLKILKADATGLRDYFGFTDKNTFKRTTLSLTGQPLELFYRICNYSVIDNLSHTAEGRVSLKTSALLVSCNTGDDDYSIVKSALFFFSTLSESTNPGEPAEVTTSYLKSFTAVPTRF